jgi:hypothetical protein
MAKVYILEGNSLLNFTFIVILLGFAHVVQSEVDEVTTEIYSVEGKVFPPDSYVTNNWQISTRVLVNGGDFVGFLK